MPTKGLAVGRVVHFTYPDYMDSAPGSVYPLMCHAAVITRVIDAERGVVNLQWFDDNSRHAARKILINETGQPVENTWHWPEQV